MDAASMFGESHIEAVIHENTRDSLGAARLLRNAEQGFASERGRLFPGQVFLAKLNPIDVSSGYAFDLVQKRREQIMLRGGRQSAAVGDVAEEGLSVQMGLGIDRRTISEGHWKGQDAHR
jgi:hypothetical protein